MPKEGENMVDFERIKRFIRENEFVISGHARIRMFQRNISTDEVLEAILNGEIIEEYEDDKPCPSALVLGFVRGVAYHVVVAECEDHARIITVYIPDERRWIDYRVRRKDDEA